MISLLVRSIEIDKLFSFLRTEYSDVLEKVWECGNITNGVFIRSELVARTISEQTVVVILQYYKEKRECELTVVSSGGGEGILRIDLGSQAAAESTFLERLRELCKINGWKLYEERLGYIRIECPFCGAYYDYAQNRIQSDGSVTCQNCNKSFISDKRKPKEPYLTELT